MPMMPPCTKPFCCVRSSRKGSSISTAPGSTTPRRAPISAIAFWRAKLSRMRVAKCGSAGAVMDRAGYLTFPLTSTGLPAPLLQLLVHALLEGLNLGELRLDVGALLQQALAVRLEHLAETLELRPLVAPGLVHVDQLADLGERESQALAAQRELEARAVAQRVDAPLPCAARREQALVLIEADGAGRDIELPGQLADRILAALRAVRGRARTCADTATRRRGCSRCRCP